MVFLLHVMNIAKLSPNKCPHISPICKIHSSNAPSPQLPQLPWKWELTLELWGTPRKLGWCGREEEELSELFGQLPVGATLKTIFKPAVNNNNYMKFMWAVWKKAKVNEMRKMSVVLKVGDKMCSSSVNGPLLLCSRYTAKKHAQLWS